MRTWVGAATFFSLACGWQKQRRKNWAQEDVRFVHTEFERNALHTHDTARQKMFSSFDWYAYIWIRNSTLINAEHTLFECDFFPSRFKFECDAVSMISATNSEARGFLGNIYALGLFFFFFEFVFFRICSWSTIRLIFVYIFSVSSCGVILRIV